MKKTMMITILLLTSVNSYSGNLNIDEIIKKCEHGVKNQGMTFDRKTQLTISDSCSYLAKQYRCGNKTYGINIDKNLAEHYSSWALEFNGARGKYFYDECSEPAQNIVNPSSSKQKSSDFIIEYFSKLKNVPFSETWDMLSDSMKQQTTFKKYSAWWGKQVKGINLQSTQELSSNVVAAKITYRMKNGKTICSLDTFTLQRSGKSWLISNQKYKNCPR